MKTKLHILLSLLLLINTLVFSQLSGYNAATYGLITFIVFKTGLILYSLVGLSYSDGFKVSFAILSIFVGSSQVLVTIMCALYNHLHIATLFIFVILFFEILFMILYFKKRDLYGN